MLRLFWKVCADSLVVHYTSGVLSANPTYLGEVGDLTDHVRANRQKQSMGSSIQQLAQRLVGCILFPGQETRGPRWRYVEARKVSQFEMKLHRDEPFLHEVSC